MKSLLTILFIFICINLHAQIFPVQVNTQLIPPYSPYLSDYTAPGAQKLMVQLRVNDPTLSEYRCKLRITIEGVGITLRTKPNFISQPLILAGGGIPQIFYGEDLAEYFLPNNMDFAGYSKNEFTKSGKLPEGVYRFSIEVLDYNRNTVVSSRATTVAWMILNDPPLLNLPRNDTKTRIIDPTNIAFTWTPRHTGSPNSAFSTEYTFRLVEIWPANRNPYDAFLSMPALYEVTTNQSQIIYGIAEPSLIPGRKYAWQVQAKDIDGRDLFKNQGRSEVYVFQFGDELGIPENFRKEAANALTLSVRWEPSTAGEIPEQYRIRYKPVSGSTWHETVTQQNWSTLSQLQSNTAYDIQVRAEKAKRFSEYTSSQRISTLEENKDTGFMCGQPTNIKQPASSNILLALAPGDIFSCADYKVVVTEVNSAANGTYSGKGLMQIKMLNGASIGVTFAGTINNQYELTSGDVRSIYEQGSEMGQVVDEMYKIGEESQEPPKSKTDSTTAILPDILVDIIIDSVYVNSEGEIKVVDEDGNVTTYDQKKDETGAPIETVVVDAGGNTYVVEKDGGVTNTGSTATATVAGKVEYTVSFEKDPSQQFGFDKEQLSQLSHYYQRETINGKVYSIPWKAVAVGSFDKIKASASVKRPDFAREAGFRSPSGPLPKLAGSDSELQLTVQGSVHQQVEEVSAYLIKEDSAGNNNEEVVGRLNIISYNKIYRTLVLVPVNGTSLPGNVDASQVQAELNKVFGQAAVQWQVQLNASLSSSYDNNGDGLEFGNSGLFSNYTGEMRTIIHDYKRNNQILDDTYYLFLVPKASDNSATGYMPRKKQAGFIFTGQLGSDNSVKIIAHELAHGAFRLEHSFPELPQNGNNLMDYSETGTVLHKYQWDLVHDPVAVLGLFEGDEEGASYSWSGTLVDEQHTELFDLVYENNHIGKLTYIEEIEKLSVQDPKKETMDLNYIDEEEHKDWINTWKIRVVKPDIVLENAIKVIQNAKPGEKLGKIFLRPNHIYVAKYNHNNRDYPIAIYNAGTAEVMENVFTKVEISDMDDLKKDENKNRIYIEETFFSYFILAFYEEGKSTPTLMIQVEKFPFSDLWHSSMEEWLKFLKILVEKNESNNDDNEDDEVLKKAGEDRVKHASDMNIADIRLYRQVVEANGRLTDDYVDCAEFVYDILKQEGLTPPSGDCVIQFDWYKNQGYDWGTDVNDIKKGDILIWDDPDDAANKLLNHTGFATRDYNNGDDFIPIIHSGFNGCYCGKYSYPHYKKDKKTEDFILDDEGNKIVIYETVADCDKECIDNNRFSITHLPSYIHSNGNTEENDLVFRYWVRPKKK